MIIFSAESHEANNTHTIDLLCTLRHEQKQHTLNHTCLKTCVLMCFDQPSPSQMATEQAAQDQCCSENLRLLPATCTRSSCHWYPSYHLDLELPVPREKQEIISWMLGFFVGKQNKVLPKLLRMIYDYSITLDNEFVFVIQDELNHFNRFHANYLRLLFLFLPLLPLLHAGHARFILRHFPHFTIAMSLCPFSFEMESCLVPPFRLWPSNWKSSFRWLRSAIKRSSGFRVPHSMQSSAASVWPRVVPKDNFGAMAPQPAVAPALEGCFDNWM